MPRLSDTAIRAAIRTAIRTGTARKLYDEYGLYLQLKPKADRCSSGWRQRYILDGKEKLLSLGVYPDVGLALARERRNEIRKQLAADIDPSFDRQEKEAQKRLAAISSFKSMALEWHKKFSAGWTPRHATRVLRRLEMHAFPVIGEKDFAKLKGSDAKLILDKLANEKKVDSALRVLQYLKDIAVYAVGRELIPASPFAHIKARHELPSVTVKHRAAIKDPETLGALLRSIDGYTGSQVVRFALQFISLTFVRPVECREARWSEITLNGDAPIWRVPAEKMKMRDDFLVPLSRQAVELLKQLQPITGHDRRGRVFPGERPGKALSENTLNAAIRGLGYAKHQHCSHGFRGTASTFLNEHQWPGDVIELQLAHDERDQTRASYNAAQHLPKRREMMQWWADHLDALRSSSSSRST